MNIEIGDSVELLIDTKAMNFMPTSFDSFARLKKEEIIFNKGIIGRVFGMGHKEYLVQFNINNRICTLVKPKNYFRFVTKEYV